MYGGIQRSVAVGQVNVLLDVTLKERLTAAGGSGVDVHCGCGRAGERRGEGSDGRAGGL